MPTKRQTKAKQPEKKEEKKKSNPTVLVPAARLAGLLGLVGHEVVKAEVNDGDLLVEVKADSKAPVSCKLAGQESVVTETVAIHRSGEVFTRPTLSAASKAD